MNYKRVQRGNIKRTNLQREELPYRLREDDSLGGLHLDFCRLHLLVKDLLMLAVPLLLLLLFALPLRLVPVQLVLRFGVQLLWQQRFLGEAEDDTNSH